jgi:hypothetical protein
LAIVNVAKSDSYFLNRISSNHVQFDTALDSERITNYAKWAAKEGYDTPYVRLNQDILQ